MRLYIGLVHYPVYNKHRRRIASAITTLDLHDISRLAKTFEAKQFFVITPLEDQRRLAGQVLRHWTTGHGAEYNRDRQKALELLRVVPSLEKSIEEVRRIEGKPPLLVATDAKMRGGRPLSYQSARAMLDRGEVFLLLFGTAWGLDDEVLLEANYVLNPILGRGDYNHLSVRSAAAIILDRISGQRYMAD